jgi:hypothetical protein
MVDASSLNPLAGVNLGGSISTFGGIALVIGIVIAILGLIGIVVYINFVKRQYYLRIHLFKLVGNVPTRVAIHCAKPVPFGMAGDKLWRVAPNKALQKAFKIIKWLPVGKIQTASNEFWYYEREDGEWINFSFRDLNVLSKEMGIRFVQEDMRLQRLATERLLEQRLMNKDFWEKWGTTIMMVIVFLVVAVCMVIIFYQWGKLLDKMTPLVQTMDTGIKLVVNKCGEGYINGNQTQGGLVPVPNG